MIRPDTVVLAHSAYRIGAEWARRCPDRPAQVVTDLDALREVLPDATVLCVSGLWRNEHLAVAPKLRFIQSISAGTDQFDRAALSARGVRLASAQGGNERAVAEHAMGMLLALARQLPQAVQAQAARRWRPLIADPSAREDELSGKTMLIVGYGRIGARLGRLAQAFDMHVIGVRRSPRREGETADEIVPLTALQDRLPEADVVALTCPLTPETAGLIDARALAAMKPGALLVNVARGKVVDEGALLDALDGGRIGGAALDCFSAEPLQPDSGFWTRPNVLVTPHSAGETRRYEAAVVDILLDNLGRLERGEMLRNAIV